VIDSHAAFQELDEIFRGGEEKILWPSSQNLLQKFPPIIVVAYFPYRTDVPTSWVDSMGWFGEKKAFEMIFKTGNIEPPKVFEVTPESFAHEPNPLASPNSLVRWRLEQEFRACLWLHGATFRCSRGKVEFGVDGAYEIGWTAPVVESLDKRPSFSDGSRYAKPGYTRGERDESNLDTTRKLVGEWYSWGINIKTEQTFRVREWWIKFGSRFIWGMGTRVRYMRVILDLKFYIDGSYEFLIYGTYVPSQLCQVGSECKLYNMIEDLGSYLNIKRTFGYRENLSFYEKVKRTFRFEDDEKLAILRRQPDFLEPIKNVNGKFV
jgi:hypothetical protein